jgi:competence protein ComEA
LLEVWALVVFALAIRAFAGALAAPAPALSVQPHRVDLDRAGVAELQVLPGLGPARAEAIVLERIRHGRFDSIDDLTRVPGLGAATVAELRPWLQCGRFEPPGRGSGAAVVDAR